MLARDSRAALRAMTSIYRGLLHDIKRRKGDVFTSRVRLSPLRKAWIAATSLVGGARSPVAHAAAKAPHG